MPLRPQPPPRRDETVARPRGRRHASAPPPRPDEGTKPALQLAIGRDGIGLELAEPVDLGCLRITELSTGMPGVRFPIDVSGGVTRFRHRRGQLHVLRVEMSAHAVERWIAPRLRGVVSSRTPDVWIEVGRATATMCVTAFPDAEEAAGRPAPILAFDVHALAEGEDLVLVMTNPRGSALPDSASVIAIACLDAALGRAAVRAGATFTLRRPAAALARALLPGVGARIPSTDGLRWAALGADGATWVLHGALGADAATPTEAALRAREAAAMLVDGDEALLRGDSTAARARYLEALERAPRHPEIAARVVEIDSRAGRRAEAALATLSELGANGDAISFGVVPGELRLQIGDVDGALASLERAGETERAPALAARAFEIAGRATRDAEAASRWLDRALARSPRSASTRWSRIETRLELGRLEDAQADVEHLDALARGGRGKYAVWLRAGRLWEAKGLGAHAGAVFERALRYAPEEPGALAGLGAALVAGGRVTRGVSLLTRALELARSHGERESLILLVLARALAERLDDLPTAIAHAAAIPADAAEALLARGLEGRWRARLGDLAGAALAFARLRDLAASQVPGEDYARTQGIVELLLEAAALERRGRRDPLAAQRHLAVALRIAPNHAAARRAYREAGSLVLGVARATEREAEKDGDHDIDASPIDETPMSASVSAIDRALLSETDDLEDPESARRVEELTRRLRANPSDVAAFDELATVLEALRRTHEIVALLAGRLEDAPPHDRAALAPRARVILLRMATQAENAGRADDAALLREALAAVPLS
jgi:tetratricopeptide (TPR) repeat protein